MEKWKLIEDFMNSFELFNKKILVFGINDFHNGVAIGIKDGMLAMYEKENLTLIPLTAIKSILISKEES